MIGAVHLPGSISLRRLRIGSATLDKAIDMLAPEERGRMEKFGSEERRSSFAVGRLAARGLLADRLGCAAGDVKLVVLPDGSVGLEGDSWHVSISHSGPHVAAAIAPHPIGVDLEVVRARPIALYRFILHFDELPVVDRLSGSDDDRIALLWSVKESVLKGRRTGLRHSPKSLRLTTDRRGRRIRVGALEGDLWKVRYRMRGGVALAVAWPDG